MSSEMMPTLFIGHGSPMNANAQNDYTEALNKLRTELPTPKAILMVSAHWETQGTRVTAMDQPKTIHDFRGFPEELYEIEYPAPGDPALARDIVSESGIENVQLDQSWGLDHGTWSVLRHIYPAADIPTIQLSLDRNLSLEEHFSIGQLLKEYRKQEVMIIGSGNIVHNLALVDWNTDAPPTPWNIEFDQWIKSKIESRDWAPLMKDVLKTESGQLSVPTFEHYLPLLYVLGASDDNEPLDFFFEGYQNATISMRSLLVGSRVKS